MIIWQGKPMVWKYTYADQQSIIRRWIGQHRAAVKWKCRQMPWVSWDVSRVGLPVLVTSSHAYQGTALQMTWKSTNRFLRQAHTETPLQELAQNVQVKRPVICRDMWRWSQQLILRCHFRNFDLGKWSKKQQQTRCHTQKIAWKMCFLYAMLRSFCGLWWRLFVVGPEYQLTAIVMCFIVIYDKSMCFI